MKKNLTLAATLIASTLLLASCSGGSSNNGGVDPNPNPNPAPVASFTLALSPSTLNLTTGQSGTVTATTTAVNGYNQAISYSAVGSNGLSVSSSVNTFTVSAVTAGTYNLTVTARGADGQSQSQSATVTVTAAQGGTDLGPAAGVHIPVAGAAVGTGDGTKAGTVYISPTQEEVDMIRYINEVRQFGTLDGKDMRSQIACTWSAQKPLTYNGLMAYAARKHAVYAGTSDFAHNENPAWPNYYGNNYITRTQKAYQELIGTSISWGAGENMTANALYAWAAVRDLITADADHCKNVLWPTATMVGTGFYDNGGAYSSTSSVTGQRIYRMNWVMDFY